MSNFIMRINHKLHLGESHPLCGLTLPKGLTHAQIIKAAKRVIRKVNNGTIHSITVRKKISS